MGQLSLEPSAARSGLIFIMPCVFIMTYWQIISDGRWNRMNITNVVILYIMSYVLFVKSGLLRKEEAIW